MNRSYTSYLQVLLYLFPGYYQYKFGYINIEHNYTEPRRTNMRKKLEENGYKYYGENSFDDIYIHPGFKTLESV